MSGTWLETIVTWFRCAFSFPLARRQLFYRLVAAQLRGGLAAPAAFLGLAQTLTVDRASAAIARTVAAAIANGKAVWEGLAETKSVPADELGIIRVSEASETLAEGLESLSAAAAAGLSITRSVIAPNAYYLVVLVASAFGLGELEDLLAAGFLDAESLEENGAYRLSAAVNDYGPWAGAAGLAAAVTVIVGRQGWHGMARRALGPFDGEHRSRVGLQFAELAARLYRRGASHPEVLRAYEEAHGRSGYARWAVREARRDHAEAGVAIESALRGRLVTEEIAELLGAMVPGGDRGLYPRAWMEMAGIQRTMLEARFKAAANLLRVIVLVLLGGIVGIVVPGIYSAYTAI